MTDGRRLWEEFLRAEAPGITRRFRFWQVWSPPCWAARARRYPARAVAVLAVAVLAASVAVAAAHPQAQGCRWKVAAVPGQRAHAACSSLAAERTRR